MNATSRDLTAELHFKALAEQRMAMLDFSPDAVMLLDLETGHCLDVNQAMCELVGLDAAAALDAGLRCFDTGASWPALRARVLPRHPQALRLKLSVVHAAASEAGCPMVVTADWRVIHLDAGAAVLMTVRDAGNASQRSLRLARTTSQLKQSREDLGRLLYIASHDLQEPLRMIGNYTHLLARRYGQHFDADGKDFMDFIVSGVHRMRTLLDDLLTYARASHQSLAVARLAARPLLEDALVALTPALLEAQVELEVGDLPDLTGDRQMLMAVFRELVGNALKFRGPDPLKVRISGWTDGDELVICVADNGIGIDRRYHEQVFELFKRLHHHEMVEGTGLGLALCRKIIDRHGGRIWVESTVGQGANVLLSLPRTRRTQNAFGETES